MSTRKSRGRIGRIFWLLAAVAMIVAVMPLAGAAAETATAPRVVDLIVDGGADSTTWVDIGEVRVWNDAGNLYIEYVVDVAPWCLTATHVDIDDIAMTKKGLPKVGKFAFKAEHDCVTQFALDAIPLAGLPEEFDIAAHADTLKVGGLEGVEMVLPDTAYMNWVNPGRDEENHPVSYFGTTITNGDELDGAYYGWCIDIGHNVRNGPVDVFSSYEDLDLEDDGSFRNIDKPQYLPHVNWVINQGFVGSPSGVLAGDGVTYTKYTYGDVQRAIWLLIDNDPLITSGVGAYNTARVTEIYDAAIANGAGFVPGCGQSFAVILASTNTGAQSTITQTTFIELGIECEDREETAWAGDWFENPDGTGDFFGFQFDPLSSWSGYFMYTVTPFPS